MNLQDYLHVFRKRWRVILLVLLLAIGVAAATVILSPKQYTSKIQFFVSTSGAGDNSALLQGSTFTQQRVKSYSKLLETPKVLSPVIAKTGLNMTPDQLANAITTTIPLDTVLIDVTVTDRSAQQSAIIAQAIGDQFPATVADLETVANTSTPSPVKVTVVRDASTDGLPVSPKPARDIALGAIIGLLLGVGAALLRDLLDTTIKGERELREITQDAVIGNIEFDTDAVSHPLIVQADPKSRRAEAFRSLRTNLRFVDAANHPRSLVVTSCVPAEGKTTTTTNLALTLAATGSRVCLVEGDLRRPKLPDYLGVEGSVGLTDVLIGRTEVVEVLQQFGDTSMWVLGAGAIPPNPSELLGSPIMERTIRDLESRFDYVLIDGPPLLPVTDSAILSTIVGGVIVLVGAGVVTKEQLKRGLASLEAVNGNVLGLVLNRLLRQGGEAYTYRYEADATADEKKSTKRRTAQRSGVSG